MSIKNFLKLVEIQTKIASLFPFLFGTLFALYRYGRIDIVNWGLMCVSLLSFDMATTTINNYMDYQKAKDPEYRQNHNIIGQASIPINRVRFIIGLLLTIATIAGIFLVIRTGILVLFIGMFSFFVGIFYTFGPIPISRMPLGEIVSGLMMGLIIPFLAVYIHVPWIIDFEYSSTVILLSVQYRELVSITLVSLPFVLCISNLMLANNICDVEQDIANDRYLLPYYIGPQRSLQLFQGSYYGAYITMVIGVICGILPWITLATLVTGIPVQKHIQLFRLRQIKSETFVVAVKNLILISLSYITCLGIGILIA